MKKIYSFVILLLIFPSQPTFSQNSTLSLENIWASTMFSPRILPEIRSLKDGRHYTELISENGIQYILVKDFETAGTTDTIFRTSDLNKSVKIDNYNLSFDEKKIILATNEENIYRHSTKSNYLIYDITTKDVRQVSTGTKQQNAVCAPVGNKVAYVQENNLFIKDLGNESVIQITADGKVNEIINGVPDWVYEEEFSFSMGYQWSPDGKYIAFYRFDESAVREFNLTYYGNLYPEERKYKYPKAGEANSTVEIHIYNTTTGATVKADVNKEADQYIPRIKWTTDPSKLCVMRLNRLQNKVELYSCDAVTGASNLIFTESNKAYIEIDDNFSFMDNNKGFIWTSYLDGYNHIYHYDMNGKLIRQITKGKWDITEFYGYDQKSGYYFFQAAMKSPMEKGVYKCKSDGKIKEVSVASGTNTAVFSNTFEFYFITNSKINKPYKVDLYNQKGTLVRNIIDNSAVEDAMKNYSLTAPEFFSFTTSENVSLNGWMIKPAGFDPGKKYPVIQYMYGGPNSQTVNDEWMGPNFFWFQLLSQKGYLIVSVDNRGTGARGEEFQKCIYKQLGHLETIDQIEVARYLAKQTFVDKDRIGAWGWSFGGYMTSLLMTKGADYFKAAVAVAPVTNWKYYDTIYTERFLQTPEVNPSGYEENSPVNFAELMKGKFLLIHGTTDDNVHLQNSMEFVNSLVRNKVQFDSFYYPNKAHSISGVRFHLYTKMTDFFLQNL